MRFSVFSFQVVILLFCLLWAGLPAVASNSEGRALMEQAEALLEKGAHQQALDIFQRARAAFEAEKDKEGVAEALRQIAYAQVSLRDIPAALESYKQAVAFARDSGLKEAYRKASDALATTYFLTGRLKEALPLLEENLAIAEAEGGRKKYSTLLVQLGYIYFQQGALDTARVLLNDALAIKEEIGDIKGQAEGKHIPNAPEYQVRSCTGG